MGLLDPAPASGRFVTIDGVEVWAQVAGSGGATVVFLPGAGSVGLQFSALSAELSRDLTTVLYDRAGTGWSGVVPLPRTVEQVAGELARLLDALAVSSPFILVGHSLGGAYAQRVARDLGKDVAAVVLLDPVHRDWNRTMPPELRIEPGASTRYTIDDIDVPAARAALSAMIEDLPPDLRDAIIDVRIPVRIDSSPGCRKSRTLPRCSRTFRPRCRVRRCASSMPQRSTHCRRAIAVRSCSKFRSTRCATCTSRRSVRRLIGAAYRPAPAANHSTLPFAAQELIIDAIRGAG